MGAPPAGTPASGAVASGNVGYGERGSGAPASVIDPAGAVPSGGPFLQPDWPAPQGVRALFTLRAGGVSQPPFDRFNLGDHVRDDPAAVVANRQRLQRALGARPVFLQQVHGCRVLELEPGTPDGVEADACLSTRPGLACTIMVADCLPVLLAHRSAPVVAAAHAGWRGLAGVDGGVGGAGRMDGVAETLAGAWPPAAAGAPGAVRQGVQSRRGVQGESGEQGVQGMQVGPVGQGVLEATFDAFARAVLRARTGPERTLLRAGGDALSPAAVAKDVSHGVPTLPCTLDERAAVAADTLVWLGPCIGPQAFQVGGEVRAAFVAHDPQAAVCFASLPGDHRFMADLAALARQRLLAMGVGAGQLFGNDSSPGWCTVSEPSRFFSHRRDAARLGSTGRMAACIWLD